MYSRSAATPQSRSWTHGTGTLALNVGHTDPNGEEDGYSSPMTKAASHQPVAVTGDLDGDRSADIEGLNIVLGNGNTCTAQSAGNAVPKARKRRLLHQNILTVIELPGYRRHNAAPRIENQAV